MVSGGSATLFADVSHMDTDKKILYLPNCGGMCSWFAGRSDDAKDNLAANRTAPVGPAGWRRNPPTSRPRPDPMTLARLYRVARPVSNGHHSQANVVIALD